MIQGPLLPVPFLRTMAEPPLDEPDVAAVLEAASVQVPSRLLPPNLDEVVLQVIEQLRELREIEAEAALLVRHRDDPLPTPAGVGRFQCPAVKGDQPASRRVAMTAATGPYTLRHLAPLLRRSLWWTLGAILEALGRAPEGL